jgi:hypothetical protein
MNQEKNLGRQAPHGGANIPEFGHDRFEGSHFGGDQKNNSQYALIRGENSDEEVALRKQARDSRRSVPKNRGKESPQLEPAEQALRKSTRKSAEKQPRPTLAGAEIGYSRVGGNQKAPVAPYDQDQTGEGNK